MQNYFCLAEAECLERADLRALVVYEPVHTCYNRKYRNRHKRNRENCAEHFVLCHFGVHHLHACCFFSGGVNGVVALERFVYFVGKARCVNARCEYNLSVGQHLFKLAVVCLFKAAHYKTFRQALEHFCVFLDFVIFFCKFVNKFADRFVTLINIINYILLNRD